MKRLYFLANVLDPFIGLTKFKQKNNTYHVNNFKSTVQFTLNSNFNLKKIIIGLIYFSKHAQL